MEMNMCNGFCELDEVDMYAIEGGNLDPVTVVIVKESAEAAAKSSLRGAVYVGLGILAVGVVAGFVYEVFIAE